MQIYSLVPTSLNSDLIFAQMTFTEWQQLSTLPFKKGSKITVIDYDGIEGKIVDFEKISDTDNDTGTGWRVKQSGVSQQYVDAGLNSVATSAQENTQQLIQLYDDNQGTATRNRVTTLENSQIQIVDNLTTTNASKALSANQGNVLNNKISKNKNNIALFGDSRCQNEYAFISGANGGYYYYNRGPVNWANAYLGQRMNIFAYSGVGGNTYADLVTRYATDISPLSKNINYLYIMCDLNDVLANKSFNSIRLDINSLYASILADGMTIIDTCGYYPGLAGKFTAAQLAVFNQLLNYKKSLVNILPNYILLDTNVLISNYLAVTDPVTPNNFLFDFATAALHINVSAAQIIGEKLAQILDPLIPKSDKLVCSVSDTTNTANGGNSNNRNLVANSLFVGTPGTAGNATGSANDTALDAGFTAGVAPTWTVRRNGTTCNIATSVGVASSGVGYRQRLKITGLANGSVAQIAPTTALTTQFVTGQAYKATAVVNVSSPVDIHTVLLRFVWTIDGITQSSKYMADVSPANGTIKAGKWTLEVPRLLITGTTLTNFEVQILAIPTSTATAASCVLDVEQFSVSRLI